MNKRDRCYQIIRTHREYETDDQKASKTGREVRDEAFYGTRIRGIHQRDEKYFLRKTHQDTETTIYQKRKQRNLYSEDIMISKNQPPK